MYHQMTKIKVLEVILQKKTIYTEFLLGKNSGDPNKVL